MPDPVPVTMSAMAPGMKILSTVAASRLGLRRDPELSRPELIRPRLRRTRAIPRLGPPAQLRGQFDRPELRRAAAGDDKTSGAARDEQDVPGHLDEPGR